VRKRSMKLVSYAIMKRRGLWYKFNPEAIFEAKVEKAKGRSRNPNLLWVSD
jgi:hypothetical protein